MTPVMCLYSYATSQPESVVQVDKTVPEKTAKCKWQRLGIIQQQGSLLSGLLMFRDLHQQTPRDFTR